MKPSLFAVVLGMICAPLAIANEGEPITRELLMEGLDVPERRAFPLSDSISPCENFHQYVCHEVEAGFELPGDRSGYTFSFSDGYERLLHVKKRFFELLSEGYAPSGERSGQLKVNYDACMNEKASAQEELELIPNLRDEILAIDSKDALVKRMLNGVKGIQYNMVDFGVMSNQANPNLKDVYFVGHDLTWSPVSKYQDKELIKGFKEMLTMFFEQIGASHPKRRARWVIAFEKDLADVHPDEAEVRSRYSTDMYKDRTQWLEDYPNLNLEEVFSWIPESVRLREYLPETMAFVNDALGKHSGYSLEQLKSVFLYRTISRYMKDAYPEYFQTKWDFYVRNFGYPEQRPDRHEECTQRVMGSFGKELDAELIDTVFPNFPYDEMEAMAERIRQGHIDSLEANAWLSPQAKKEAIRKMEKARLFLAKPSNNEEWDFNPVLPYDSTKPYANRFKLSQAKVDKTIRELDQPRSRTRWSMAPLNINAYYSPTDNKFVMLQGILQYPFFDAGMTEIERTAAIGTIIGHELGHGIDDQGAKYDADGKLNQWMTEDDLRAFKERGDAFVARFNEIGHNGDLTLGENIADHVGLRVTYNVAEAFEAASHVDGGLSVADQKAFFQAYARMWCGKMLPSREKQLLATDPHSMGWARINEQVIHLDGFYEAYQCKKGDKMYVAPNERIKVW